MNPKPNKHILSVSHKSGITRILVIIGLMLIAVVGGVTFYISSKIDTTKQDFFSPPPAITLTSQSITPSSIINLLNKTRFTKDLPAFISTPQLSNAALARANYMVTNKTTSLNTGGDTSFFTDANFNPSTWYVADAYNDSSTQDVINVFDSNTTSSVGLSKSYADVGVAVVADTIDNVHTQLVIAYFANQAPNNTSPTTKTSNTSSNNSSNALSTSTGSNCTSIEQNIIQLDQYQYNSITSLENTYASDLQSEYNSLIASTDSIYAPSLPPQKAIDNDVTEANSWVDSDNNTLKQEYNQLLQQYQSAVYGYEFVSKCSGVLTPLPTFTNLIPYFSSL